MNDRPSIDASCGGGHHHRSESRPAGHPPGARRVLAEVKANEPLGTMFRLTVVIPGISEVAPGRFAMLQAEHSQSFLARAISVSGQRGEEISFFIAPIGDATRELCALRSGDRLWVLGPLGKGFDVDALVMSPERAVLVAGGAAWPLSPAARSYAGTLSDPVVCVEGRPVPRSRWGCLRGLSTPWFSQRCAGRLRCSGQRGRCSDGGRRGALPVGGGCGRRVAGSGREGVRSSCPSSAAWGPAGGVRTRCHVGGGLGGLFCSRGCSCVVQPGREDGMWSGILPRLPDWTGRRNERACATTAPFFWGGRFLVPDLSVQLGPLRLEHPLINASGTMELFDVATALGPDILSDPPVAAYVPKTVTLEARTGNAAPRILETASGMINAIGLPGRGIQAFVEQELPRLLALPCPVIISVGGFSRQEYVLLAEALREALDGHAPRTDWSTRAGLELNISCPNVHSGCVDWQTRAKPPLWSRRCGRPGGASRCQAHSQCHRYHRDRSGRSRRRSRRFGGGQHSGLASSIVRPYDLIWAT